MKIINPPEKYDKRYNEITCFMAGGMGNIEWQTKFLETLNKSNPTNLVIFNPYNSNITSVYEQIAWEKNYLDTCDIFSIYFDKYTDQPISMFELGRMLQKAVPLSLEVKSNGKNVVGVNYNGFPCVISLDKDALKIQDITIQCGLMKQSAVVRTPEKHAKAVLDEYYKLVEKC